VFNLTLSVDKTQELMELPLYRVGA